MITKYTESHEWVSIEGTTATVGITEYVQDELGDIIFAELPEVGKDVEAEENIAILESTMTAYNIYTPVSGKVIEVNENVCDAPELINQFPEGQGWLFKITLSFPEELDILMDQDEYLSSF